MAPAPDLERFVRAQDTDGTYAAALAELRQGRKSSHWMWFVLPQVAGLGRSPLAQEYALQGLSEARSYLAHPVLHRRLVECCEALLGLPGSDPVAVLGPIDAVKLRSSMTVFSRAAEDPADRDRFDAVPERYFGGEADAATASLL